MTRCSKCRPKCSGDAETEVKKIPAALRLQRSKIRPNYSSTNQEAAAFTATTLMEGANTRIEKTDLSPLKGKDAILRPDNDEPGRKYVGDKAELLLKLPVSSLKITPLTLDKPAK